MTDILPLPGKAEGIAGKPETQYLPRQSARPFF